MLCRKGLFNFINLIAPLIIYLILIILMLYSPFKGSILKCMNVHVYVFPLNLLIIITINY